MQNLNKRNLNLNCPQLKLDSRIVAVTRPLNLTKLTESINRIDNWSKRIDSVTLVNPSHVLYCQSQFAVKANELTEGKSPLNFAMVIAAQGINGYLSVSAIT